MSLNKSAGRRLRDLIRQEQVVAVGAFNPFVARMVEQAGFNAVYMSGAALSNGMAFPDEGILPRSAFLRHSRELAQAVEIPVIVDIDTGFGGPRGVKQTVAAFEHAGAAAIQIEDQDPYYKRCGHLDGKRLIAAKQMVAKIEAAVEARRDDDFVIIARTDARAVEGMDQAIERSRLYLEAGADVIFPEAPATRGEFAAFREALTLPLVANMTEFGKSPWITDAEFAEMKYEIVLHPVTLFRRMAEAVREALDDMKLTGNQESLVNRGSLMPRAAIDRYLIGRELK